MSKIFVNYVIQNDPWDNINEPNLYVLPGTYQNLNSITAKLIYDTFPVKNQKFYLRFFLDDKIQDLKLWMDYPPSATVPVYTDKIFVKALRLPKSTTIQHKGDDIFQKTSKPVKKKTSNNPFNDNSTSEPVNQKQKDQPLKSDFQINADILGGIDINLKEIPTLNMNNNQKSSDDSKNEQINKLKKKEETSNKDNGNFDLSNFEFPTDNNKNDNDKNKKEEPKKDTFINGFEFISYNSGDSNVQYSNNSMNNTKKEDPLNYFKNENQGKPKSQNSKSIPKDETSKIINSGLGGLDLTINFTSNKEINPSSFNENMEKVNVNKQNSSKIPMPNLNKPSGKTSMMDGLDDIFKQTVNNDESNNIKDKPVKKIENDFTSKSNSSGPANKIDMISDNLNETEWKEKVDYVIGEWIQGVSQPKNLLLLLSTLHEVWSKDEKLKNISVREMIEDNSKASREYRRAMILFHDDKIKKYSAKDQYVAKSLYYILTKANEEYRISNESFK